MTEKILIIGAGGQIGTELTLALRDIYGDSNVIATDIRETASLAESGPFEILDAMSAEAIHQVVKKYEVTQVYLLAAMLSATAEKNIELGWRLNMKSLANVLELAREKIIHKVYWPSSIAAFGPNTPKEEVDQYTIMDPNTVYGISKLSGELWCRYYHDRFGVDVRSLRYPGIISWKSQPGGGTTDYAIHIYHEALENGRYESFLDKGTRLPMMYMPDAIRATLELMEAPSDKLTIRSSYNLGAISFAPENIAASIQKFVPDFEISYKPDFRQAIADSWPSSIDDSGAREDWGWNHQFDLDDITDDMLSNIRKMKRH
jgi:nucleoside-diphosphate-sugar epimerase